MKNKKDIVLSVKRSAFRSDDPTSDEADSVFKAIRPSILSRDNNTCQYCGFRSDKYQEVHHIDDNHSNNSEDNLITICSLCHSCFHIGYNGEKGRGDIIRLNSEINITQAELNQLIRVMWIAEESPEQSIKMLAVKNLARFNKQTISAERKIGTADPLILGDWLLQLDDPSYDNRGIILKEYFYLPRKSGYIHQFNYWKENVFKNFPSTDWISMSNKKLKSWAENKNGDSSPESILLALKRI